MKRIKHSKYKNTGLIFELLVRQVASDTMNNKDSKALRVIRKHFNAKSELAKELKLYQTITEEKFNTEAMSEKFVDAVIKARGSINESQLRRDKYNLIRDLKSFYNLNEFFKARVKNYRLHASVYKLFEFAEADDPKEYVSSKYVLIEHVNSKTPTAQKESMISEQHKDVQMLASKILVDKFNQKYSKLTTAQKNMLREYINNVTNTESLKKYVLTETAQIQEKINKLTKKVHDKAVRIKLTEVSHMISELNKRHIIQDKDVLTMLRYYDLVHELEKIGDDK